MTNPYEAPQPENVSQAGGDHREPPQFYGCALLFFIAMGTGAVISGLVTISALGYTANQRYLSVVGIAIGISALACALPMYWFALALLRQYLRNRNR